MTSPEKKCLPLDRVIGAVMKVEHDIIGFYESVRKVTKSEEVQGIFGVLAAEKQRTKPELAKVWASLVDGTRRLESASQSDMDFLSALAQSAFYRQAGNLAELANPALESKHHIDNALKLEKDLLLFYLKFYAVSCADHKPVFSSLIAASQRHIGELANVKVRLDRGL